MHENVKWRKSNAQFYTVSENFCDSILLRFWFNNTAWNSFKYTALNLWGPRSYLRILAEVDNAAEEVEETLEALEWLEQVDEGVRRQLLVILGGNLDAHLKLGKIFQRSVVTNSNLKILWRIRRAFQNDKKSFLYKCLCLMLIPFWRHKKHKSHKDVRKPLKSRFPSFFACWWNDPDPYK